MDLAKPGDIKNHCDPNALSTFLEYLLDYATGATMVIGEKLIADTLASMAPHRASKAQKLMDKVRQGKRDVFC